MHALIGVEQEGPLYGMDGDPAPPPSHSVSFTSRPHPARGVQETIQPPATTAMIIMPAGAVAKALLLEAFEVFEGTMDPVVKLAAQEAWPDPPGEKPAGWVPAWLHTCKQCLGHSMKGHMTADLEWDTCILGTVMTQHLRHFLPSSLWGNDAASEMHRYLATPPPAIWMRRDALVPCHTS